MKFWKREEEPALLKAMERHGLNNWEDIAPQIPGKSAEEVKEHFRLAYPQTNFDTVKGTYSDDDKTQVTVQATMEFQDEDEYVHHLTGERTLRDMQTWGRDDYQQFVDTFSEVKAWKDKKPVAVCINYAFKHSSGGTASTQEHKIVAWERGTWFFIS